MLLLALSSGKSNDNYKNNPIDSAGLTRSLHIRPNHSSTLAPSADSKIGWSVTPLISKKEFHLPRRADISMTGKHQQQQLRCTPLFFAGQIPAQRIVAKCVALRIFPKTFEKLGVGS